VSSILAPMLNLFCPEGHRWYSPNPESWKDAPCGYQINAKRRCVEPLKVLPPTIEPRGRA
jgi:hypothetical protein